MAEFSADKMKRKKIIHLDDHRIVCEAVRNLVKSQIPGCYYLCFTDTSAAFKYLINSIDSGNPPDLLVTDFNHNGMNGYEFSKSIRQVEKLLNRKPMKILLLMMLSNKVSAISRGLKERVFNGYLSLISNEEKLLNFIIRED